MVTLGLSINWPCRCTGRCGSSLDDVLDPSVALIACRMASGILVSYLSALFAARESLWFVCYLVGFVTLI
jgi:hypothetical protein